MKESGRKMIRKAGQLTLWAKIQLMGHTYRPI